MIRINEFLFYIEVTRTTIALTFAVDHLIHVGPGTASLTLPLHVLIGSESAVALDLTFLAECSSRWYVAALPQVVLTIWNLGQCTTCDGCKSTV